MNPKLAGPKITKTDDEYRIDGNYVFDSDWGMEITAPKKFEIGIKGKVVFG